MKKIRIIAALLALLMVLPLAVACSGKDGDDAENTVSTQGGSSTGEYDANGYLKDYIPADLRYDGDGEPKEVTVLAWSEVKYDFYNDGLTEDIISNAVFERKTVVEDRLGVKLEYVLEPGNNNNRTKFVEKVTTAYYGGSADYDIIGSYSMTAPFLSIQGMLADMSENQYMRFDGPWWNDTLLDGCSIGDELYFVSGDMAVSTLSEVFCIQVNMDMLDEKKLDDPRQIVADGEWTLAKMFEMITDVYDDYGATGKDESDVYGLILSAPPVLDAFLIGSDIRYVDRNANNVYSLTDTFESEKTYDLIGLILRKRTQENDFAEIEGYKHFANGNSLFTLCTMGEVITGKSTAKFTYSVIPIPMHDDEQKSYKTTLGYPYTMFSVPTNAYDTEMSGVILECMASEGYRQLRPVIYDAVKYQNSNDELDVKMFDIIIEGITYDIGRIFNDVFEQGATWSASPVALFRDCIVHGVEFYSNLSSNRNGLKKGFEALNTKAAE